ncbi:MAG: aspartate-semialdehyde dehydrogenase [Saprospiraceae bacterium]
MRVAVVGVTGLVGHELCRVLEEVNFPITEFIPVASARSAGKQVVLNGKKHTVVSMEEGVLAKADFALFSAGGSVSLEWAPRFAEVGTIVIDNSSAFRMDSDKKLIVPEVNGTTLTTNDRIIANPNCSTIQMVLAMGPLHAAYELKRLVISTYQSFTGTGMSAVKQYEAERGGADYDEENAAYPHPIFENCLPHCDVFMENGYTREEMKLVHETRKIIGVPDLAVTATAVRVPVHGGHSEAINAAFAKPFEITDVRKHLAATPGLIVQDDVANNIYPMPRFSKGRNEVFVGRIRRDESLENALNLWVVADNLRKGAATNTVQIAQYLVQQGMVRQPISA